MKKRLWIVAILAIVLAGLFVAPFSFDNAQAVWQKQELGTDLFKLDFVDPEVDWGYDVWGVVDANYNMHLVADDSYIMIPHDALPTGAAATANPLYEPVWVMVSEDFGVMIFPYSHATDGSTTTYQINVWEGGPIPPDGGIEIEPMFVTIDNSDSGMMYWRWVNP